jgi:hypothetical protein
VTPGEKQRADLKAMMKKDDDDDGSSGAPAMASR